MLTVVGIGGHATAVAALAEQSGWRSGRTVPYEAKNKVAGNVVVGVGCSDMKLRERLYESLTKRQKCLVVNVVSDKRSGAVLSFQRGSVIFPHVTLGAGVRVGANVVIYSNAVVEHESSLGDHVWISPGAILCGEVTIEPRVFIGAGAIILPGVTIGEGAKIGAGLTIHDNVADGVVKYGRRD